MIEVDRFSACAGGWVADLGPVSVFVISIPFSVRVLSDDGTLAVFDCNKGGYELRCVEMAIEKALDMSIGEGAPLSLKSLGDLKDDLALAKRRRAELEWELDDIEAEIEKLEQALKSRTPVALSPSKEAGNG